MDLKNQAEQVIYFFFKERRDKRFKKKLDYRKFLELTNVFFNNLKAKF